MAQKGIMYAVVIHSLETPTWLTNGIKLYLAFSVLKERLRSDKSISYREKKRSTSTLTISTYRNNSSSEATRSVDPVSSPLFWRTDEIFSIFLGSARDQCAFFFNRSDSWSDRGIDIKLDVVHDLKLCFIRLRRAFGFRDAVKKKYCKIREQVESSRQTRGSFSPSWRCTSLHHHPKVTQPVKLFVAFPSNWMLVRAYGSKNHRFTAPIAPDCS